ncbi:MAG: peptidase S24 [Alphaproteobacteria bacterium]|nr:peptidase S24 [Alphaproteobacteria bacterium]
MRLIQERTPPTDLKKASLAIGRNHAYLHQLIHRGTPRVLPEESRLRLADYLDVEPDLLLPPSGQSRSRSVGATALTEAGVAPVPEVRVTAQAGGGALVDREDDRTNWFFPADWLRHELRSKPGDLRIITIDGDSMEPILLAGDKVMVDLSRTEPSPPGIFVLNDGFGLVAKRIELIPNSSPPRIAIVSANDRYARYERDVSEVRIIGRVVWFSRRL